MRKLAALLVLMVAAGAARAQTTTPADALIQAQAAYEKSNYELARTLFSTIISSRLQVTDSQKVVAYTYLGAYWSLQNSAGARDSANSFFWAALDYDPFTDLDRNKFAPDEVAAFGRAKAAIFKIGIKPVEWKALAPTSSVGDSARYNFRIAATHSARAVIEIASLTPGKQDVKQSFPTISLDGVRDIPWDGLINTQRADTGLYVFRVTATDQLPGRTAQTITETQTFRIDHFHAPLEEELPPFKDVTFGGTDTLKSRIPTSRTIADGVKGLFIASAAIALPAIAFSNKSDMSSATSHAMIGASLGILGGGGAALYANRHRDDARAAAENARRRNLRNTFNAGVRARNAARLDKTILIIRPLTAAGIGG